SDSGYETSDIAGDYEFINHGNSTDAKIIDYSKISLSEDGKISGAVTGTWSQADDSSSAVITIDNQSYSGYFIAAQDENGKKVMSFTAVGNNNQTIWGVQTKEFTGTERNTLADYTKK
ncbi:MAG: transposase, partial [Ruminococcus sp.]|nr:transposase [Ruminococcus sp.]